MKKIILCSFFCYGYLMAVSQSGNTDFVNRSVFLLPEFTSGKVHFKKGTVQQALFNYNLLFQQMIFSQNGNMAALSDLQLIDTVYFSNRKFIPVDTVFYEVRLENTKYPLYVHHTCTVEKVAASSPYAAGSQTGAIQNINTFRYGVATPYQLLVPDNYTVEYKDIYMIRQDDEYVAIKGIKQLKAIFPDKDKVIKAFVKESNIDFGKLADVEKLMVFCEGL